jgi:hypothetical protein
MTHPEPTSSASMGLQEPVVRSLETYFFTAKGVSQVRRYGAGNSDSYPPLVIEALSKLDSLAPLNDQLDQASADWNWKIRLAQLAPLITAHQARFGKVPITRNWTQNLLTSLLLDLRAKGYLVNRPEFIRELQSILPPDAIRERPIGVFGIPTRDRPESLRRALESYLTHFQKFGRSPRIVVADVSTLPAAWEANQTTVRELSSRFGIKIEYLGPEERDALIEERSGGDPEKRRALTFCLKGVAGVGHTYGLGRNLLMMATRGERCLSVDDDTLAHQFRSKTYRHDLRFFRESEEHRQTVTYFTGRDEAKGSLDFVEADLLAPHEALLGHSSGAALVRHLLGETDGAFSGLNHLSYRDLALGRAPILMSFSGLVGDTGGGTGLDFLFHPGVRTGRYRNDRAGLHALMQSREITKISDESRVFSNGPSMTIFYGYDHTRDLPPFMPHFRMEDALFKDMLKKIRMDTRLAYVPYALEHAPMKVRANTNIVSPHARHFTMQELIGAILKTASVMPEPSDDFTEGRRQLARALTDFAEQPLSLYRRRLTEMLLTEKLQKLANEKEAFRIARPGLPQDVQNQTADVLKNTERELSGPVPIAELALLRDPTTAPRAEEMTRQMILEMARALLHF